jgi:uncharacterized membrane protein YedE/YeeE
MNAQRAYAAPYVAGCCLGLVLLAAFVVTGQGLGASGAFANVATGLATTFAPGELAANNYFAQYAMAGAPWTAWMVVEVLGIVVGAAISAALSGRLRVEVNGGPKVGRKSRLAAAATGGALMGLGAVLARGCTSGQALSGGALLSVGSWTFMVAAFAAGFAVAPIARGLWR